MDEPIGAKRAEPVSVQRLEPVPAMRHSLTPGADPTLKDAIPSI